MSFSFSAQIAKPWIGKKPGFKDFLMGEGPDLDGVDLSRDRSAMRDISL